MMLPSSPEPSLRRTSFPQWLLPLAPFPALLVGIVAMRWSDVPRSAWLTNVGAAVAGVLLFAFIRSRASSPRRLMPFLYAAIVLAFFVVTFASPGMEGVHRWVSLGGLRLHASAIFAPLLIGCIAAIARRQAIVAIAIAFLAVIILAVQPDAAQAVSVAAACSAFVIYAVGSTPIRIVGPLLLLAAAAASFLRKDPLPPVPHVEGILALVASGGPVWTLLGIAALILLPLPFFMTFARSGDGLPLALGVYVTMIVVAPFWGTFPVPVMGYGASPILGYFIALAWSDRSLARFPNRP